MNILGIIPARGGSKGIPGKNIKPLDGKPLLQYTIESGKSSKYLSALILSSDDQQIMAIAESLLLEVPFIRPAHLAKDTTPSIEVILHALEFYKEQGKSFDAVCLLQPTTPFRKEGLIDSAIEEFMKRKYDSLLSVRQVPEEFSPHWVYEEEHGMLKIATGEAQIISRRQDLPKAYHRDGAVYLTRTEVLLEQKSLYGKRTGFIDTTDAPYVNIDLPSDWEKAEELLKSQGGCAE